MNEPILPGTLAANGKDSNGAWTSHNNGPLRDIYVQITSALRASGDRKIIFAEAGFWAMNFAGLTPAWDDNMVYSFHWYPPPVDSGVFTNANSGPGFAAVFDANVPLWLGETGENTPALAARMASFSKTAYKGHAIGWSWWTTKKLGGNNQPWTCPFPPEYTALRSNWGGTSPDAAFAALMKWAQALQTTTCTLQTDYVTALGGTP
jgi:endoglucanase